MPSMVVPCCNQHPFRPPDGASHPFLNHRGQGNPANERICRHIIKLENLREELPPLLKKYNLDKAGHPETSFWALAFCRKSTCSIDVKILMFPKALPEGIEWIGRQGIATGNKCQRIKHFQICKRQLLQCRLHLYGSKSGINGPTALAIPSCKML